MLQLNEERSRPALTEEPIGLDAASWSMRSASSTVRLMVRINVYAEQHGRLQLVSSVEAQYVRTSGNQLFLDARCGGEIADAVVVGGSIPAGGPFVVEVNGVAYRGCRIVGRGAECKIMFLTKGGLNDPPVQEPL